MKNRVRKAKVQLELRLAREVKDNVRGFCKVQLAAKVWADCSVWQGT